MFFVAFPSRLGFVNSKIILITGAGGYIGSVATYLFLQKGYRVVALDNFLTGYREPLEALQKKFGKNKLRWFKKDLRDDLTPIFKNEKKISAVVHFAASCSVDESMKNPQLYFSNNVCGTGNLLETMLRFDVKNMIFSSTCAVYGEAKYLPVDENHPTQPTNPYGESKLMAEKMLAWYGRLKGLKFVILRYFNVCGATDDGLVGDAKKPSFLLVQNAVRGALKIHDFCLTCPVVDTPDGTPIRDYVNVIDVGEAHLAAFKYLLEGGKNEVLNLGTGGGDSVLEIIEKVKEITGVSFDVKKTKSRQGEYAKMVAAVKKAKRVLGWEVKRAISDSVRSLVIWYEKHPNGWKKQNFHNASKS